MRTVIVVLAMCVCVAACGRGRGHPASPVRLEVEGRSNAHVTLAADGDRVAAAWIASAESGSDVLLAISENGGRSFGTPIRVNETAGDASANGEQPPRVVLKGGTLAVVWVSRRGGTAVIRSALSPDGGRTFSPARTISPEGVTGARGWESAAIADDGTVHAAWLDGRNAAPMPPGATHVHEGGAMRQDIVHATWRSDGAILETPVAENVCFCCKTGVAAHGNEVFVVWRHLFPGGVRDIAIARSTDSGRTFSSPQRVSEDNWKIDACPDDGPSLIIERDGAVRVAWPTLLQDAAKPRMAIFEAVSRDGGRTFSARSRVDASEAGVSHPRLAAGPDGSYAIVWDELSPEGRRVMIRRGTTAPEAVAEGATSYPAVVAVRDGFLVGWTEQSSARSVVRLVTVGR